MPRYTALHPSKLLAYVFREERRSSVILLLSAVAAAAIANSPWSAIYSSLLATQLSFGLFSTDVHHFINEGLMAFFFLIVTLEVRREFVEGELATWRKAAFPVAAALGGMLMPALIFTSLNPYPPASDGWAIPMATDIALAIGVLGLLGTRITKPMRVFLLSLAIVDDIASIIVIGLFYARPDNLFLVVVSLMLCVTLWLVRNARLQPILFPALAVLLWVTLTQAGLSGTLAGVIVALVAPIGVTRRSKPLHLSAEAIEKSLLPVTSFVIVPLFAFANAGIQIHPEILQDTQNLLVFSGVIAGLVFGKPMGILLAGWVAVMLNLAHRPATLSWRVMTGLGFISGIGFTVSLLIAGLAYGGDPQLRASAALGIICASVTASLLGIMAIRSGTMRSHRPSRS